MTSLRKNMSLYDQMEHVEFNFQQCSFLPEFHILQFFLLPMHSFIFSSFSVKLGFRIPTAVFRIPSPRIPDSTSKNFPGSGIRIPLHEATESWSL